MRKFRKPPRGGAVVRGLVSGWLALLLVVSSGCDRQSSSPDDLTPTTALGGGQLADPQVVLTAMSRAYREAPTYADSGQVRLRYIQGTTPVDVSADFSVTFARPNRLRMHVYQAIMISDGETLHATIADLPQQVLRVDSPRELSLESIYSHELLSYVLTNGIAGGSIQIALLLEDDALSTITQEADAPVLLEPASIGGHRCYRVQLRRTDGTAVFWIDQETFALRRFEYPTDELKKHLAAGDRVADLSLVADFHGATLGGEVLPVAFQFEVPRDARLVDTFVHRPQVARPMPPSELLGQPAPSFSFTALDGAAVTRESLAGKIVVLDFWFTTCPPCRVSMPRLEQVYQKYARDERVEFLAVSVDDPSVSNEEIRSTLTDWGATMSIVRDKAGFAQSAFKIPGAPSLFVIGADGRVQASEVGVNPKLVEDLAETLDRLLAGEDTVLLTQQRYDARLAEYEQALSGGDDDDSNSDAATTRAEISRRGQPTHLRIMPLWHCTQLTRPGNILATKNTDGVTSIMVVEGNRQVVEIDHQGQVAGRHSLDLPEGAVVTWLRAGMEADGQRLVAATASMQDQVHVFDQQWRRLLSYPRAGPHDGITDARLADLDGDGRPEINVAFWGTGGVHNVQLDGTRRWTNTSTENVFHVAVGGTDNLGQRGLLCANGQGNLVPIDAAGNSTRGAYVGGRFLTMIVAGDLNSDGWPECCGLARNQAGIETAVGVGSDFTELWNYPLPYGAHQNAIEPITSGRLLPGEETQWVLAGADGSIHILSGDGRPVDMFHYGAELTGLAVTQIDGRGVLLVATDAGVEAWRVETPDEP